MYCRLLDDLDTQARHAPDRISWARAACKIAVHRARQGQVDEAHTLILRVRETFGGQLHHEIAPWVMLAEGVIHYFRLEMRMSWERLRRAYALAVALRMESAQPTCAAWMAVIAHERSDYDEMSRFLIEVFEKSDTEDHHARGRASAVLAVATHMTGNYELARRWYDKARLHAAAQGDQAMISAMLFNVAVCRVANLLLVDTFDSVPEKEIVRANMEIGSFRTYDSAVGAISFEELTPLIRGHLHLINKEFPEALDFLEGINKDKLPLREVSLWMASKAWCLASLGRSEEAWCLVSPAISALTPKSDTDDFAYVYGRAAQVANLCERWNDAARLGSLATMHREKYRSEQLTAQARLGSVAATILDLLAKKKGPE